MNTYRKPIYLSGPHGGGKSTLTEALKKSSDVFLENDFDIDFTIDFPSIASLSHFERSLVRLYHRFFIAHYAESFARKNSGKIILTNRTVYDSEAYIHVYRELKWITEEQFQKLQFVMGNFAPAPRAIVLNPSVEVIKARLSKRRDAATRSNRDKIFQNEDSDIFIEHLRDYFTKFQGRENVLYLENNEAGDIKKIIEWVVFGIGFH